MQPTLPSGSDNPEQYDPKTTDAPHNTRSAEEEDIHTFFRQYYANEMSKRTMRLISYSKEMISKCEGRVNSINSLALVISFVAGVQATIIVLSIPSKDTALARTTNTIAFLGLVLDVTGALTGLMHSFHIQDVIRKQNKILGLLSEFENDVKSIKNWYLQHRMVALQILQRFPGDRAREMDENDLSVDSLPINDIVSRTKDAMLLVFAEDERLQKEEIGMGHLRELLQVPVRLHILYPSVLTYLLSTLSTLVSALFDENPGVSDWGVLPITAMGYGSICLLISTMLLAARDLHRETWITCLVVGLYIPAASLLSGIKEKLSRNIRKMARRLGTRDESTRPPA
ncbi:hypothetical protein D9613_010886 [Agrocybe pediades]|uniref:Uncharacterized protein n=1 Tax=Agrocybe pediades TaxID=84607 RepID=A0A8H4QLL4_9AGAR|nr:hypothetical protein D9613_010886 [Agrocybe pediades]